MGIGAPVQVSGTEGAGLSIRSDAGTGHERLDVALDGERFVVIEGPVEADGLTWWKIQSVADPERQGWAAADYLTLE
jgi:uncharacterized protein YraI